MKLRVETALILALLAGGSMLAQPTRQEHWVATWATAQQLVRIPQSQSQPARGARAPSTTTFAAAPQPAPTPQSVAARGVSHQTIRMIARTSLPGRRLRVRLSNAFGSEPVVVSAAHIALRAKGSEIVPGSDRALLFSGQPQCTIGPGVELLSDPVDLNVPATADLAVSLYFAGESGPPTIHGGAFHTTYISKDGDFTGQPSIPDAATTQSYYWLAGIDVAAPADAATIVTLGDSITDGARSTPDTNHSWPALLAARLAGKKETSNLGVANVGIGGNRVLRDIAGASALARFDRDVLAQPAVKWVMLLEGINDIGHGATDPSQAVTAEDLIAGYTQLIERAHAHDIKIIGCTITPFEGAAYYRETGEAVRATVNNWIRTSGAFDAVVDFDAATRDPANPKHIRPDFDPGDHLHPNDAGYEAMANAVDLAIFTRKPAARHRK